MLKALVGGPANREAIQAFADKRPPDFTTIQPDDATTEEEP